MAFEIAGRHHLSHFCVSSVLWIRRRQGILPNLEAIQIVRIKSFYGNLCMSVFDCRQDKSFLVKRKSVLKTMRTGGREGERQRDSDRETQRERETQCAQLIVNNQNQMVWPLLKGQKGKQRENSDGQNAFWRSLPFITEPSYVGWPTSVGRFPLVKQLWMTQAKHFSS